MKTQKKLSDETAAKVAFEMTIECLSRLVVYSKSAHSTLSFATVLEPIIQYHVRSDIIQAAIAQRRLADLIECQKELSKIYIAEAKRVVAKNGELGFYRTQLKHKFSELISKIIHHRMMGILDNEILETPVTGNAMTDYRQIEKIQTARRALDTLIEVKSDKGAKSTFALVDFVEQALEFMEIAEEKLAEKGILVGTRQFG